MLKYLSGSLISVRWLVATLVLALVCVDSTSADVISSFDSAGDVTLSSTQAAGTWYTDRYAPAGFESGTPGGGRNGVLTHSISSADSLNSRPGSFKSAFYNTQGRKFDLPGGTQSAEIQLYVPDDGFTGRYAGFWATAYNDSDAISAYPILEYNNDGFRAYDVITGLWSDIAGFTGTNQWYTLGLDLFEGQARYFINGTQVASFNSNGSDYLGNVILQGYNTQTGADYSIYWDNLSASANPIPEPTTLALFGLGALGVMAYRRRKSATASA